MTLKPRVGDSLHAIDIDLIVKAGKGWTAEDLFPLMKRVGGLLLLFHVTCPVVTNHSSP